MATIRVSDHGELMSALSSAKGGDSIVLGAGSYGSVTISQNYSSMVTISSAAPLAAKLTYLNFAGASNVRVDGVHIDNPTNGGPTQALVRINSSSHDLQVVNSEMNGAVDGNYGGFLGVFNGGGTNILIKDNDIHDVYRGMISHAPKSMQVIGNNFSDLGDDAMKFAGATDILIEDNFSSGPVVAGKHLDFIQVQGNLSADMVVRGNVLMVEDRTNVQGIFFGTKVAKNILVEDNIIHTAMYNGIYFREGSGIVVRDNTLINLADSVHTGTMVTAPKGSVVTNNILTSFPGRYTGLNNGNLILQNMDPDRNDYITEHLINADRGKGLRIEDLGIVKGSLAETMGAIGRLKDLLGGIIDRPEAPKPPAPEGPPQTPASIYSKLGDIEIAGNSDVISVAPSAKFAATAATVAFSFEADSVKGVRGLVTKDADAYVGGGNHFATWIEDGVLSVMFEGDNARKTFTARGIQANTEYDVQAAFGDGKVYAWLNGKSIGSANFATDWTDNAQYLQVGAHNGWNNSGASGFSKVFDGTISDLKIVTGVQTPAKMAAGGSAGAPPSSEAPPSGGDSGGGSGAAAPVFARKGDLEFAGNTADIIKVKHSAAMEVETGALNFAFNADTVGGRQGLVSKDAPGGGDHLAAWLEGDSLMFRFEDGGKKAVFEAGGIRANRDYEVLAAFDDDQVSLFLGDKLIGRKALSVDLAENREGLQIGGWDAPEGGVDDPFAGTISDVFLFDRALAPDGLI